MRWIIMEFPDGNIDLERYTEESEKLLREISDGFIFEFESKSSSRWEVLREYFENKLVIMCKNFDAINDNRKKSSEYYGISRGMYYRYIKKEPQLMRPINTAKMAPGYFQIEKLERLSRELGWYKRQKINQPKFRASRPRKE